MFTIKKSGMLHTDPPAKRYDFDVCIHGRHYKLYTDIHPDGSLNAIGLSGFNMRFHNAKHVINFLVSGGPLFSLEVLA